MPDEKEPIPKFAARIKTKYPEYRDMNDTLLAQKILAKYPEYADMVDMSGVSGTVKKKVSIGEVGTKALQNGSTVSSPTQSNGKAQSGLSEETIATAHKETPQQKATREKLETEKPQVDPAVA